MENYQEYNIFEKLDSLAVEYINLKNEIKYRLESLTGKYSFLRNNLKLKNIHEGNRAFIVGNAPSINQQDILRLKDEITFMVNRSFMIDQYEEIKPDYHVIVDSKLADGIWPIDYLDQIYEKNKDVKFLLNADWYYLDKFAPYREKYEIYWLKTKLISPFWSRKIKINLSSLTSSYFVSEQALTAALYMGIKSIFITGIEGNGYAYQALGMETHAHGSDPDYLNNQPFDFSRSLQYAARWIRIWYRINEYCKLKGVRLINCTPTGVLTMLEKKDFDEAILEEQSGVPV